MIKKIDKYLLSQFVGILLMALVVFIAIFIIVDLIENLDRFIDNKVPAAIVINYYFFTMPWFINIALPMSVLIATIFSLGLLAKRNEWTAMKATGISLYRIAVPLFLCGIILSAGSYVLDNYLVAQGNEKRFDIEREYIKQKARRSLAVQKKVMKDVFLQKKENLHISLSQYNTYQRKADGVNILNLDQGKVFQRIDAKEMTYIDSLGKWVIHDYSIRHFNAVGQETGVKISKQDSLIAIDFVPNDIAQQFKSPEELNYENLSHRIELLKENGVNTLRWEVVRQFKISFAFTNLIVMIFGLPLVVMKLKGGLAFGAGMSVFVIFGYYVFIKFGQSLGFQGILSPIMSAWIGNIVFLVGGAVLIISARK